VTIAPPETVRCRYCRRDLFRVAGYWVDGDSIAVCMKYDGELPATEADYFWHEPDTGD